MAKKKVRRVKKRKKSSVAADTAVAPDTVSNTQTTKTVRSQTKSKQNKQQVTADDFRQEYAYVLRDLRTVLILAAVMFALLIALNLILQ